MNEYGVTDSPHIRRGGNVPRIFWTKAAGLAFLLIAGGIVFGLVVLRVALCSVTAALLAEALSGFFRKAEIKIYDGNSFYLALLFSLCFPPAISLWVVFWVCFLSLFVAKEMFGGTGGYLFHPVLAGYLFVAFYFPETLDFGRYEKSYSAFFLALQSFSEKYAGGLPGFFLNKNALIFSEAGLFFTFIFSAWMVREKINHLKVCFIFLGVLWLGALGFGQIEKLHTHLPLVFFIAFCFVDEPVTLPLTHEGRYLFAVLCALGTHAAMAMQPLFTAAALSILIMGVFSPWMDNLAHFKRISRYSKAQRLEVEV